MFYLSPGVQTVAMNAPIQMVNGMNVLRVRSVVAAAAEKILPPSTNRPLIGERITVLNAVPGGVDITLIQSPTDAYYMWIMGGAGVTLSLGQFAEFQLLIDMDNVPYWHMLSTDGAFI